MRRTYLAGPVVVYVPSATGTMPQAQRMRKIVWEMLLLVRTSVWGFLPAAGIRTLHFFVCGMGTTSFHAFSMLFSCLHIMSELSCHYLQLHLSTSPDTPPVGPRAGDAALEVSTH